MLLLTCFVFGLLGSLTWAGPRGRTVCPFGTFAYKGGSEWHCYKFYEEQLNFQEAEQQCQEKWRGHLASFSSDRQVKSLAAYVARGNIDNLFVWIGLRRDEGSNIKTGWRWVDGSSSRYTKWSPGEPNNAGGQYCVALNSDAGYMGWNDLKCDAKRPFLCKWTPA